MTPAVFDASVAAKWFLTDRLSDQAVWARQRYQPQAPGLILHEVTSALSKYVPIGGMTAQAIGDAIDMLCRDMVLVLEGTYLREAARLAVDLPHPSYDIAYVALAQHQGMPLITADKRLCHKIIQGGVDVEVVELEKVDPP